jgi:bacillithiol system protein YtxJ
MVIELHEEQDLQPLLEHSQKKPVVFFKHSTQCSRSAVAHDELQRFASRHPDVPCGMVLVIEDRELSESMEERLESVMNRHRRLSSPMGSLSGTPVICA